MYARMLGHEAHAHDDFTYRPMLPPHILQEAARQEISSDPGTVTATTTSDLENSDEAEEHGENGDEFVCKIRRNGFENVV